MGGHLSVGAPMQAAPTPATVPAPPPPAAAPAPTAAPALAAAGPAARAGRFSTVYSHRPVNGPLPVRRYGATAAGLQLPAPPT